MFKLNYIFKDAETPVQINFGDEPINLMLLYSQIEVNPTIIFFYTVDSTDIF